MFPTTFGIGSVSSNTAKRILTNNLSVITAFAASIATKFAAENSEKKDVYI